MSRRMEEEILKAIGAQAVWYNELQEEVTTNNDPWTQEKEEDFLESIQSLKDKHHVNNVSHTTGQETNIFQLTMDRGMPRWARIMKREGLI